MGLRLREGIDLEGMATRFNIASENLLDHSALDELLGLKLTWQQGGRLGITAMGMPLLDAILPRLAHDDLVAA